MRGRHDAVRQTVAAAVPVTELSNRFEVLVEKRCPVLLVGEVHVHLDRGAGNLLAVERGSDHATRGETRKLRATASYSVSMKFPERRSPTGATSPTRSSSFRW